MSAWEVKSLLDRLNVKAMGGSEGGHEVNTFDFHA